jgi:sigma-E factor negative regulatory protein RseA
MTNDLRESISALMDDEANEIEIHRVLSKMDDEGFRKSWKRYQVIGSVMRGERVDSLQVDISKNIASAIESEHLEVAPGGNPLSAENIKTSTRTTRFIKPLTSVAVAASVAFMVVFGVSQFNQNSSSAGGSLQVAEQNRTSPLPAGNITGGVGGNRSANPDLVTVSSEQSTAAQRRLRLLMNRHTQQADMSLGRGVLPSAQLVNAEESKGY